MSLASSQDGMIGTRLTILPETVATKRQLIVIMKQVSTATSGFLEGVKHNGVQDHPGFVPWLTFQPVVQVFFLFFLWHTLTPPSPGLCTRIPVLLPTSWLLKRFIWGCLFVFLTLQVTWSHQGYAFKPLCLQVVRRLPLWVAVWPMRHIARLLCFTLFSFLRDYCLRFNFVFCLCTIR